MIEGAGALLQPLLRGRAEAVSRRGGDEGGEDLSPLAAWLCALRALGHAGALHLDLSLLGARSPGLIARVVEAFGELERNLPPGPSPRLFLDRDELRALLAHDEGVRPTLERLLAGGLVLPTWAGVGERISGPGCRRRVRERGALACGGAAALNLPRLARAAGPWREDAMLEGLAAGVERAVTALAHLARFQREHRGARTGEAHGRIAYALAPVGLGEALCILGDGEPRLDQGARILGLCAEAARRFGAAQGLSVVLTPFFAARARARFARIDAERPRLVQSTFFGDAGEVGGRSGPYSCGFGLGDAAHLQTGHAAGEAEAELCSTVAAGVWTRTTDEGSPRLPSQGRTPLLHGWERFDELREAQRETPAEGRAVKSPSLFPIGGGTGASDAG